MVLPVSFINIGAPSFLEGGGGIWINGYNCTIKPNVCGTITTLIDHNIFFLTERTAGMCKRQT